MKAPTTSALAVALVVGTSLTPASPSETTPPRSAPDAATWIKPSDVRPERYGSTVKHSFYITARDGTRLAADVYLPKGVAADTRLPAVLEQTRYYRTLAFKPDPAASCKAIGPAFDFFAKRGYAVVVVDVRGSGASFGTRATEFSDAEVKDGAAVVDWIISQPWSNGSVGATGVSYVGTTSELLLLNHHPAVKAVAPISIGFDFYADIDFPGGLRNAFFIDNWAALNQALDEGHPEHAPMAVLKAAAGPCPVDEDADGRALEAAVAEHAENLNSAAALRNVRFRDDRWSSGPPLWPKPYAQEHSIDASNTPLLDLVGWADSGYAKGAINMLLNTTSPQQRLIIGATNHGMTAFYGPGVTEPTPSAFNVYAEVLRFFDHYVAGLDNGYEREPRLRWFTTGSNVWNAAGTWPKPARTLRYALGAGRTLTPGSDGEPGGQEVFTPTADAKTGDLSRWNTTLGGGAVAYGERSGADDVLLAYTSAPLEQDLTVTGAPVVTLKITNTAKDADYLVYLEEVDAAGHAFYVTEGELRASHGRVGSVPYTTLTSGHSDLRREAMPSTPGQLLKLDIALLPLSHCFAKGTRLRLVLAGSDSAHFSSPSLAHQRWIVKLGLGGSSLALPVVADADISRKPPG
jgi:putative CocE/NonD family hydrolase